MRFLLLITVLSLLPSFLSVYKLKEVQLQNRTDLNLVLVEKSLDMHYLDRNNPIVKELLVRLRLVKSDILDIKITDLLKKRFEIPFDSAAFENVFDDENLN